MARMESLDSYGTPCTQKSLPRSVFNQTNNRKNVMQPTADFFNILLLIIICANAILFEKLVTKKWSRIPDADCFIFAERSMF